ncbi:hypothetical protein Fmac_029317 [Flemingia macrophylla]|uniref:Uncharacterized protein n=1 Tax=Flemingia macrophylla TaxID=520843 RepID=A0ABD1LAB1_9FABA
MKFVKEFEARTYKIPSLWVKIEKEFVKEFEARSYEILSEFRFDPKDEILVDCYLWKKILFEPLPHDLMRECDVKQTSVGVANFIHEACEITSWTNIMKFSSVVIYGKRYYLSLFPVISSQNAMFSKLSHGSCKEISSMGVYRIFKMEGKRGKKARVSQEEASTSGNNGEVINATPVVIDLTEECDNVAGTPLHASSIE